MRALALAVLLAAPSGASNGHAHPAPTVDEAALRAAVGRHRGWLPPESVDELMIRTGLGRDELVSALLPIAKDVSRAQVSNFPVGAVALGASGAVYFGGNLSFIGVPNHQTVHAEQAAIALARMHGERRIVALAVSDEPCGHCRQFLNELGGAAREDMRIIIPGRGEATLAQLLPRPFVMGKRLELLSPPWNNLIVRSDHSAPDDLLIAALQAADQSNSKYGASGVALRAASGRIYAGGYLESDAGNPSLPPLQTALIALVSAGEPYESIREAVLVELAGARVRQAAMTRELLAWIAPGAPLKLVTADRP